MRFDAGYETGDKISQYYDNLVGKLIVWGKDRPTAIARTIRALEEMVVEGVATTIPADLAILRHPDFQAMEHSTKWVEETLDLPGIRGKSEPTAPEPTARPSRSCSAHHGRGQRQALRREDVGARDADGGRRRCTGGQEEEARSGSGGGGGGRRGGGRGAHAGHHREGARRGRPGRRGRAGVVVLEAMKMENQINAEKAGTVKEIKVAAGDTVGAGDVVVVIE